MAKAEYRSAIRSRRLINDALADLLLEKPLEKITVTDIVNRAQINRGTFYAHYKDVPDVVNHLVQNTFSSIAGALSEQSLPLADIPRTLLKQVQKILEEDLDFFRKIMTSGAAAVMQDQLVSIVMDYMLDHRDAFYYGSPEHYEVMIRFCSGGLSKLYRDWFEGKIPCSLNELTDTAENLIRQVAQSVLSSS